MGRKAFVAAVSAAGFLLAEAELGRSGCVPVDGVPMFKSFAEADREANFRNLAIGVSREEAFAVLDDVMRRKAYSDGKTGRALL